MEVVAAYLDHGSPRLRDLAAAEGDVVVPLLLSIGYHAAVDIPAAVGPGCVVTPPLGPDPRLAAACADRLREAGWVAGSGPVVLAAAGSSDPRATEDVQAMAGQLAERIGADVTPAFLSAAAPALAEVVDGAAAVATYLIAPGQFADRAAASGCPIVSDVLGAHPALVDIVVARAEAAFPNSRPTT